MGEKVMTLKKYVEKIKNYLNNKPKTWEECSDFYQDIEYDCPDLLLDTEEHKKEAFFIDDVLDICEMVEPFSMCEKEDKLLFEVMKKYGYM